MRGLCREGSTDCGVDHKLKCMKWNGFDVLETYIGERISEYDVISDARNKALTQMARQIREEVDSCGQAKLIFICTHNSRRSHLGHLWAQLAASFFGVDGIYCYSGGTEVTAFNPQAVKALEGAGMHISRLDESSNPVYQVSFSDQQARISTFSKKYTDPPNPTDKFIAVMTCSDADEACPVVQGAIYRYAIHYEDPGAFDGAHEETAQYAERCRQIAREMLYLFSRV